MENKEESLNVVVTLNMKPGSNETLKPINAKLVTDSRASDCNLRFDWFKDTKNEGVEVVIQTWKNMEAFVAHSNADYIKQFRSKISEQTTGPATIRILKSYNEAPTFQLGDETSINILATIKGKQEVSEEMRAAQRKLIEATRAAKGTLRYDWYKDTKEEGIYVVIECYASMLDFKAHLEIEEYKNFKALAKDWVVGETEVRILKPQYLSRK